MASKSGKQRLIFSFVGPSQSKMTMRFRSLIPVFLVGVGAVGVPPGLGKRVFIRCNFHGIALKYFIQLHINLSRNLRSNDSGQKWQLFFRRGNKHVLPGKACAASWSGGRLHCSQTSARQNVVLGSDGLPAVALNSGQKHLRDQNFL